MAYLPCAMVYVSQYIYFGFAKSALPGDTVRGVLWVSGSSSSPPGRDGWLSRQAATGMAWAVLGAEGMQGVEPGG